MGPFRHQIQHLLKIQSSPGNPRGAVLLTVVFVLIIIGLAGAAIYSLTTTSTYTQMNAQNASRARYMAESGFRTVVAQYNDATEANKNTALEDLHNETLTLPGGAGQFDVRVYPYWFYVNSDYTSGAMQIFVRLPGGTPLTDIAAPSSAEINLPGSGGKLKVQGKTQRATIDSSASTMTEGLYVFNLKVGERFPFDISAGEEIFLVYQDSSTDDTQPDVSLNGTLTLPATTPIADFIPQQNGSFRIHNEDNNKTDYTFSEKTTSGGTIQLSGIVHQNAADPSVFPIGVTQDMEIYFGKNLAVVTSATQGQGQFAGEKTIVTYSDVGLDGGFRLGSDTISFAEDIEDFDNPLPMNDPDPTGRKPIEVDPGDGTTEPEIRLGGGLNDGYGSVWYGGDSDVANCIDGRCNLGRGVRAYFEFVADMDSSANSTTHGDGFTFAISSGVWDDSEYRNSTDDTGSGGEYMGYAGPGLSGDGIEPPKLALEIDTYPNTGFGSVCASDSRRDDADVAEYPDGANHVALDFWGTDFVSPTPGSLDAPGGYVPLPGEIRGAYMRVGALNPSNNSPEDWSSTQGTISFWFKRNSIESVNNTLVGDRMWGQSTNMEMRFTGNGGDAADIVLDWGGNNSLTATNPFTQTHHWYFLAVTWNESDSTLRLYWGDEDNPPSLQQEVTGWNDLVSSVGVTRNLFLNSSGGGGNRSFIIDGRGMELRYYDTARTLTNIQSDYNQGLDGSEAGLQAYFPLQSDFTNAAGGTPTATAVNGDYSCSWSSDVPTVFSFCSSTTYDDNRHGSGDDTSLYPMNSLNTDPASGEDGYYQVARGTDLYNWMEDGKTYGVRMELIRPFTANGDGNYDYQVKAWVECVDATCTDLNEVQKANFSDTRSTYSGTTPKLLRTLANGNPLVLDPSVDDDLKKILFGFTQGTGGATQDITLTNFEIRFIKRYPVSDLSTW